MRAKDLLTLKDLSKEEILEIIDLSEQLKYETKHGIEHHHLKGKTLGMIFTKSSTRTRVSFEVGMYQLGGFALFLNSSDIQMSRGEAIEDTGRVLARYLDGIMIRTYDQREVEELATASRIPIINGLTDEEHPCQVLADLLTIKETKRKFKGLKVAFVGDGHNMANTLMIGCLKVDMDFSIATPKGYEPKDKIIEAARIVESESLGTLTITNCPEEAVKDADIVITDVWTSMGQETEKNQRKEIFKNYQVNKQLMCLAKADAMVLHCLPAHKDEEITTEVFEEHQEEIFEESENRLHVQKAILVKLMGKR